MLNLPEVMKIVEAVAPVVGGAAAVVGDYISVKNAQKVTIVAHITQGHATTVKVSVNEATAVAGTGAQALSATMKIWALEDCAAGDALVRQTDAANFTTSAALKHKLVVIEIDPAQLSAGFDCLAVEFGITNAANLLEAMYFVEQRYQGIPANTPSVIVD